MYDKILNLSSNSGHGGNPIRAAYEDVRFAPQTSLLQELDSMGFLFPRSTSIVDIHEVSNNEEPGEDASAELEATQGPIGTLAYPNETTQFSS